MIFWLVCSLSDHWPFWKREDQCFDHENGRAADRDTQQLEREGDVSCMPVATPILTSVSYLVVGYFFACQLVSLSCTPRGSAPVECWCIVEDRYIFMTPHLCPNAGGDALLPVKLGSTKCQVKLKIQNESCVRLLWLHDSAKSILKGGIFQQAINWSFIWFD